MVDVEREVFVAPGDIVKERRAAEGGDCGHVGSNGAIFHYLEIHLQMFAFLIQLHFMSRTNTHSTSA